MSCMSPSTVRSLDFRAIVRSLRTLLKRAFELTCISRVPAHCITWPRPAIISTPSRRCGPQKLSHAQEGAREYS